MDGSAPNLYNILRLSPDADPKAVKAAFRELAKRYHPDSSGGEPADAEMFRRIEHAYRILSDPGARADYDRYRESVRGKTPPAGEPEDALEELKAQLNYVLWEVEDLILGFKRNGTNPVSGGRTLTLWLLEIPAFLERWVLEPTGDFGYILGAGTPRQAEPEAFLPYVNAEGYFYDIRKRMSRLLERLVPTDLIRVVGEGELRLLDGITEALVLSYHYLGAVRAVCAGSPGPLARFRHLRPAFTGRPVILLPFTEGPVR